MGALNLISLLLPDYNSSDVLLHCLPTRFDHSKAPNLAGGPVPVLAFNIGVEVLWSLDPALLEKLFILISVAQLRQRAPVAVS